MMGSGGEVEPFMMEKQCKIDVFLNNTYYDIYLMI